MREQHWNRGATQHVPRHPAEQELADAAVAVGAHHQPRGLLVFDREIEERLARAAMKSVRIDSATVQTGTCGVDRKCDPGKVTRASSAAPPPPPRRARPRSHARS